MGAHQKPLKKSTCIGQKEELKQKHKNAEAKSTKPGEKTSK